MSLVPGEWSVHGEAGLWLHKAIAPPEDSPAPDENPDERSKEPLPGIRCPLCAWQPRVGDLWSCTCGMAWNTFLTHGRCPRCAYQWRDTMCLACHRWSRHLDWYVAAPRADC